MKATFSTPQPSSTPAVAEAARTTFRPAARIGDKPRRGFAAMDPAKQQRIAVAGGKASQNSGRGHKWTSEEAREVGRKGGLISRRKPKPKAEGN